MSKKWKKPGSSQKSADGNSKAGNPSSSIPSEISVRVTGAVETSKTTGDKNDDSHYQGKTLYWARLTFFAVFVYAGIAALQWCSMKQGATLTQRQITDNEDAQAAQLTIDSLAESITDDPKLKYIVTVSYRVCNVGNTVANQVGVGSGMFMSQKLVPVPKGTPPIYRPDPNGFSIGAHDCSKQFTDESGMWNIMDTTDFYYWSGYADYVDIFRRPGHTGWCIYHEPHTRNFYPCQRVEVPSVPAAK